MPETHVLFIGAGEQVLVYDLLKPSRLAAATAEYFWGWRRWGQFVLMQAELELAAWTIHGRHLWTTFADPPHSFRLEGDELLLEDCGGPRRIRLEGGQELRV